MTTAPFRAIVNGTEYQQDDLIGLGQAVKALHLRTYATVTKTGRINLGTRRGLQNWRESGRVQEYINEPDGWARRMLNRYESAMSWKWTNSFAPFTMTAEERSWLGAWVRTTWQPSEEPYYVTSLAPATGTVWGLRDGEFTRLYMRDLVTVTTTDPGQDALV